MSRKTVKLTVDVVFDGEYYGAEEVVEVSGVWIEQAFEDRDDVKPFSLKVTGTVTEES